MAKVIMSIKSKFAARIFDGSKKYEYRRRIFKQSDVTKVIIYVPAPTQKVIGEFEIGEILCEKPSILWEKTSDYAGITGEEFKGYFGGLPWGYAIEIKSTILYANPLPLQAFGTSTPPVAFKYLR